jgi:hypothetical protein
MSILTNIASNIAAFWKQPESGTSTPTRYKRNAPAVKDWTDGEAVNFALTSGVYHNTYPGMKLAGFGFNIINVPVSFMGLPIPKTENEAIQEELNNIVNLMTDQMKDIHIQCHREGTIWIYPKFTAKDGLIWEFIRDDSVSKIVRDVNTGKVFRIETDEEMTLSVPNSTNEVTVRRKRVFTKTKITVKYEGQVPEGVKDKSSRNPAGILPIPFSNNADGDEVRGHSDYERIVTDLKNYHDTDLAESTALIKFSPKIVQTVKDAKAWAINQGGYTMDEFVNEFDVAEHDLFINTIDEKTELLTPDRVTASYTEKLKQIFHKLVEISGVPEIAWGLKTQGNMASVEENMAILMNYVRDKQEQKVEAYEILFTASLRLLNTARLVSTVPNDISIEWNNLESLSAKTRSEIFKNIADGLSKIVPAGLWSFDMIHKFMLTQFTEITPKDSEEFKTGIKEIVGHLAATKASLEDLTLLQGGDPDT